MRIPAKENRDRKSPPAEMVVAQITSAACSSLICSSKSARALPGTASRPLPLPLPLPFGDSSGISSALNDLRCEGCLRSARPPSPSSGGEAWSCSASNLAFSLASPASKVISSRTWLTFSGLPTRMGLAPSARSPIAMLSTATLLSEVANKGERSNVLDHIFMICTETWVLPVPGGPWITVQVCRRAERTASRCDWFRCVRDFTSLSALSNLSDSVPPGLSLASFAAGFSLVSCSAFSAASAAARLSSSVMPPLRHCFDQLSARPTLAVISSSETRGRGFVTRFNIACSCRS
mmetsp:Transcript_38483/g.114945  ORF Transcript_38483/g.114945 Transcript_38483/m.114945 type:complete len:292 (+) Transcript_38483:1430-2305(+)